MQGWSPVVCVSMQLTSGCNLSSKASDLHTPPEPTASTDIIRDLVNCKRQFTHSLIDEWEFAPSVVKKFWNWEVRIECTYLEVFVLRFWFKYIYIYSLQLASWWSWQAHWGYTSLFLCQCDILWMALGYPSVSAYGSVGLLGFEYHSGFSGSLPDRCRPDMSLRLWQL